MTNTESSECLEWMPQEQRLDLLNFGYLKGQIIYSWGQSGHNIEYTLVSLEWLFLHGFGFRYKNGEIMFNFGTHKNE